MKKETKILGLSITAFIILLVIIYVIWKFYPKAKQTVQSIATGGKKQEPNKTTTTTTTQVNNVNTSQSSGGSSIAPEKVEALQKILSELKGANGEKLYPNLAVDKVFGSQTKKALYIEVQKMLKVTADGIFGTKSKEAFKAAYNQEPTDENILNVFVGSRAAANLFNEDSFFNTIFLSK